MKGCADLVFEMEDPEKVYQALKPEAEDELHRSHVKLILEENCLRLRIEGSDVVSLRAALNTWIRLIKIATEMVSI
ncbi:MAG TPA: KEOPS complex subunit Pcc1 [Methanotrichaceae archaeon]|nr:KEOPS complex subunit Pcc1 [Methanotrichaceae archaeon]